MMTITIILSISIILFIHGKIRADLVAFSAMLCLMLTGIITPSEALSGFGDPVVFVITGLFVVSAGVFRTGLAKIIGSKILLLAGSNETKLYFLMVSVAMVMGMCVTGSGTVALFIPIIISMSISRNINVSRFLMPLGFIAGIGSSFTMMNTINLATQRVLLQNGYDDLHFFSLAPIGLIAAGIAIVLLWVLSKVFLSKRRYGETEEDVKSLDDLVNEYKISSKTFFAIVKENSPLLGIPLKDLKITEKYGVNIIQRLYRTPRRQLRTEMAGPLTVLVAGNKLELMGNKENIDLFMAENGLEPARAEKFDMLVQGIAEALLMPSSILIGKQVKDSGFREKYNVNILAINRHGEYVTDNVRNESINAGDALLVQGTWDNLTRLDADHANLVLVGKPLEVVENITLDHKAPVAGVILVGMIALLGTEIIPTVASVLIAAVLMILTGCLKNIEEAYRSINWGSIVIIASMMPMALAMHKTGMDVAISDWLMGSLGGQGPHVMLAGIYTCVAVMTFFINGTPLAVLFAPIGYQIAVESGVSPYPFLIAVAMSANHYFGSIFSSAINVMVMAAGRYKPMDFIKLGVPLQIAIGLMVILILPLLYPF